MNNQELCFHVRQRIYHPSSAKMKYKTIITSASRPRTDIPRNHFTGPYLSITAGGSLGGRSVRHAVPAGRVEAEQLSADAFVLEARGCPPVPPALGVQREERTGQGSPQGFVLVRRIVQATGGVTTVHGKEKRVTLAIGNHR